MDIILNSSEAVKILAELKTTFSLFALGQNGLIQEDQLKTIVELFCRHPIDDLVLLVLMKVKKIGSKEQEKTFSFKQFQLLLRTFVIKDAVRYFVDVKRDKKRLDPIHRLYLATAPKDEIEREMYELSIRRF